MIVPDRFDYREFYFTKSETQTELISVSIGKIDSIILHVVCFFLLFTQILADSFLAFNKKNFQKILK